MLPFLLSCTPAPSAPLAPPPPPPEARLTVSVVPSDAAVILGGQRLSGDTLTLSPGDYPLSIARRGFAMQSTVVSLPPLEPGAEPTALSFTLEPQPQAHHPAMAGHRVTLTRSSLHLQPLQLGTTSSIPLAGSRSRTAQSAARPRSSALSRTGSTTAGLSFERP